jgi:hypothetical protein
MPQNVVIDGVPLTKHDGECVHPACNDIIDFKKWDKPPPGWATLSMQRYTKKGGVRAATFLLCPIHTVKFVERQLTLTKKIKDFVRVVVESPFASNVIENLKFARAIMRDCLLKGEAPFLSHALYTQEGVLSDQDPEERRIGIEASFAWGHATNKVAVYKNLGISNDMKEAIARHTREGRVIESRYLQGWQSKESPSK